MSKRSNKGKAYFYAMGQRAKANGVIMNGAKLREMRLKLSGNANNQAIICWHDGYCGF